MRVSWFTWIVSVTVIGLLLGVGPSSAAPPSKIVVYSGMDEYTMNVLTKAFEPMTGIKVESLVLAAAGTMAARVRSEAAAPKADIFIGGSAEIHAPLARDGLLLAYRAQEETSGRVPAEYIDPSGLWHGFYAGPLVIIVNRRLYDQEIKTRGGPYPQTWDDLLHATYARRVAAWNPATVGGGYIFMVGQIFRAGNEDKGFDWLKRFDASVRVYGPTGPSTIPLVVRGEAVAGIAWLDDTAEAKDGGQPLEYVIPPDTAGEIGAVSIIKGGPNSEGAKRFVDFVLTKGAQEVIAKFGFKYPVRTDVPIRSDFPALSSLKFVKYDRPFALQNRDRLTKKWEELIGSQRR
jgi:iron(III) transport system substrate-binding protein